MLAATGVCEAIHLSKSSFVAFRDPRMVEDFAAPRLAIDVAEFHTYAVDWRPGSLVFAVDAASSWRNSLVRHHQTAGKP